MIEIDILIPAENSVKALSEKLSRSIKDDLKEFRIGFDLCTNVPHISLYQLNVPKKNLDLVLEQISDICDTHQQFDFQMDCHPEIVGSNIFWRSNEATQNSFLKDLLHSVVNNIKNFKHKTPLRQIVPSIESLSKEQISLIEKYGVFWGLPDNFDPHITLVYNLSNPGEVKENNILEKYAIDPLNFFSNKLCVGQIGYHGNVEEIISCFKLSANTK